MSDLPEPRTATLMRVAYDGTEFHGFARQRGLRTVQGELERVLSELYGRATPGDEPLRVRGASRTDAGVHAHGQLVAFDAPDAGGPPAERLRMALWGKLPPDIEVSAAWSAQALDAQPLHPRRHNLGKHYRYAIRTARGRDPKSARFEWSFGRPLDRVAMQRAARAFVGEHDFASFRAAGCQAQSTMRRIDRVDVTQVETWCGIEGDAGAAPKVEGPGALRVDVHGSSFLMHMVRIMVGSLVEVGLGRKDERFISQLLQEPDRSKAGPTAPALGLTLEEVKWPRQWPPV